MSDQTEQTPTPPIPPPTKEGLKDLLPPKGTEPLEITSKFKPKYDWAPVKKDFVEAELQPRLSALAERYQIPEETIRTRQNRDGWKAERDAYWAAQLRASESKLSVGEKMTLELQMKVKQKTLKAVELGVDRFQRILGGIPINKNTGLVDKVDLKDASSVYFKITSGFGSMVTALAKAGVTFGNPNDSADGKDDKQFSNPIMIAIQNVQGAPIEKAVKQFEAPIDITPEKESEG